MEAACLVRTRRRLGTLVTAPEAKGGGQELTDAARQFVRFARQHELSDQEANDLIRAALIEVPAERKAVTSG